MSDIVERLKEMEADLRRDMARTDLRTKDVLLLSDLKDVTTECRTEIEQLRQQVKELEQEVAKKPRGMDEAMLKGATDTAAVIVEELRKQLADQIAGNKAMEAMYEAKVARLEQVLHSYGIKEIKPNVWRAEPYTHGVVKCTN